MSKMQNFSISSWSHSKQHSHAQPKDQQWLATKSSAPVRSLHALARSLARSLLSEQIWILFLMTQAKLFEPRVHGGLKLPLPVLVHRTESIPNPLGRGAVPERATHGTSPRSAVRRGPGVMPTRRLP